MLTEKCGAATSGALLLTNEINRLIARGGPARGKSRTSRQRRIIAPLDPLLSSGGIIRQMLTLWRGTNLFLSCREKIGDSLPSFHGYHWRLHPDEEANVENPRRTCPLAGTAEAGGNA